MDILLPPICAKKYQVERRLGAGGCGIVYYAIQRDLRRPVALKLLGEQHLGAPELIARFTREARITAQLSHPSIVKVLDFDVENGIPWIVYEYLSGTDLKAAIASGPLPLEEVLGIGDQMAEALEVAHRHGIVHRDIKPANIHRSGPSRFKLTDFGIAKLVAPNTLLTGEGAVLGSVLYLAPEVAGGQPVSVRSDLYSLGVTLFELLTGRPPFVAETLWECLQKHQLQPPPAPSALDPSIPPWVDRVILKALAKRPEDRYASAHEMGDEWKVRRSPSRSPRSAALPLTQAGSPGDVTDALSPMEAGAAPAPDGVFRNIARNWKARLFAGTLVLLMVGTGLYRWGSPSDPSSLQASVVAVPTVRNRLGLPRFPGHRQLGIKVAGAPVAGARVIVRAGMLTLGLQHQTREDQEFVFEDLPPSSRLTILLEDGEHHLLSPPVDLTTPALVPLENFICVPTDSAVLIDADLPGPTDVVVTVSEQDGRPRRTLRIEPGGGFVHVVIDGLIADTEYRACVLSRAGWGGVADYRFRTRSPQQTIMVKRLYESVENRKHPDPEVVSYLTKNPDPRLEILADRLVALAREDPSSPLRSNLTGMASRLRSRLLAGALVPLLRVEGHDAPKRAAFLKLLADVRATEAGLVGRLFGRTGKAVSDERLCELVRCIAVERSASACDFIQAVIEYQGYPNQCPMVISNAMRETHPDRARTYFTKWTRTPPRSLGEQSWYAAAMNGLMRLGTPAAVQVITDQIDRKVPGVAQFALEPLVRVDTRAARKALSDSARNNPQQLQALWAAARAGCEDLTPLLRRHISSSTDAVLRRNAALALGYMGSSGDVAILERGLEERDPEMSSRCAWALGQIASACPTALREFALSPADLHASGLQALGRIGDARLVAPLQTLIERLRRERGIRDTVRLAVATWTLGQLVGKETAEMLRALSNDANLHPLVFEAIRQAERQSSPVEQARAVAAGTRKTVPGSGSGAARWTLGTGESYTHLVLPLSPFDRTGVYLYPGESVELSARGYWCVSLESQLLPFDDAQLAPALQIAAIIGSRDWPIGRNPDRRMSDMAGEIVLIPSLHRLWDTPDLHQRAGFGAVWVTIRR